MTNKKNLWVYQYSVNNKYKKIRSKSLEKLEEKVKAQREIKDMEAKRNKMRRELFESQDIVDKQKEELINQIESKLNQTITENELFTIRWRLV